MRGDNGCLDRLPPPRRRFTPTCVGTIILYCASLDNIVHPHMRGDNSHGPRLQQGSLGSPPHAWGQCIFTGGQVSICRFTPTCVGTIGGMLFFAVPGTVHPHMRGDNEIALDVGRLAVGSPPHAWGQCADHAGPAGIDRFTPTCVGTMTEVCDSDGSGVGSPPHAWGQLKEGHIMSNFDWFTPTCVGTIRTCCG